MKTTTTFQSSDPEWCDVVMRTLPVMFRRGQVNGLDDSVFVYASTFYSVQEEVRRGASHEAIRHQRNRILQSIDAAPSSDYEKEQFAGPFARAVDDALSGRSPCVLQVVLSDEEAPGCSLILSLDGTELLPVSDIAC